MARYNVVREGDPVLRRISKPVKEVNANIVKLMNNMAETMYHSHGVGLAAPQVGINKRVIVVDVGEGLIKLANPEIIKTHGIQNGPEGCLSIPGLYGNVKRSNYVKIRALDENNEEVTITAKGFEARALQHEMDHLDGILFIDKATDLEREESR
jgi:peptide deformylase